MQIEAKLFCPVLLFMVVPALSNVLFLPRGQIYASFTHWTLHFPIETRTSWTFAQKLEHRIQVFKRNFTTQFAKHRQELRNDPTNGIWKKFMHDSAMLDNEMNVTLAALQHLQTPENPAPARTKRALLPFVGDALSSLFGTATSTELHDVLSRVNDLSESQNDFLNVIDNTVTMVNQTIVDVSVNRQTINRLTDMTKRLTERLIHLKDDVLNRYFSAKLESDLDTVFTDLVTTVRDFRKSILDLETILSLTENSILPRSLLPPSRFVKILEDIQKALPRDLALPFFPSDTDKYYSTSHTQTMRTNGEISVLVTIPLLSVQDHFKVFQIFNIPVPKTAENQNFVANYEIEPAKFIALSEDSLKFMFIDDDDFHVYLRQRLPFCPIRRPIMNALTSTMCVPALLTNQTDKITKFCDKVISVNQSVDPTAEYLGNGNWIVVSVDPLDLEIRCKTGASVNSTRSVKTVSPLSLVALDFGCAAFSHHFQLPTHFRTDSYLEPYQVQHMKQTMKTNNVWSHVSSNLDDADMTFNQVLETLPPMHTNAIKLSALKRHIRILKSQTRHHFKTVTIPAVSVTTLAVLVALVLIMVKYVRCTSTTFFRVPSKKPSRLSNPAPTGLTVDTSRHTADLTCQDVSNDPTDANNSATPNPSTSLSWLTKDGN